MAYGSCKMSMCFVMLESEILMTCKSNGPTGLQSLVYVVRGANPITSAMIDVLKDGHFKFEAQTDSNPHHDV